MARPKGPPQGSDGPSIILLLALAALIALGVWWWQSGMKPFWESFLGDGTPPVPERSDAPPERLEPPPLALPEPAVLPPTIEHPLPPEVEQQQAAPQEPLPALDKSDPTVRDALVSQLPSVPLPRFANMQDYVKRFVVTVDNLPRNIVPSQLSVLQRVPNPLIVDKDANGTMTLSPQNSARYQPLIGFLETLDPAAVVRLYARFYPLMDEEYKALGYPEARFHDRVIFAIDDMLAAPRPKGPVELIQPRVLYEYADPAMRALSAGQKVMVRVGPENAERLRALLRRFRAQLLGQTVN